MNFKYYYIKELRTDKGVIFGKEFFPIKEGSEKVLGLVPMIKRGELKEYCELSKKIEPDKSETIVMNEEFYVDDYQDNLVFLKIEKEDSMSPMNRRVENIVSLTKKEKNQVRRLLGYRLQTLMFAYQERKYSRKLVNIAITLRMGEDVMNSGEPKIQGRKFIAILEKIAQSTQST